MTFIASSAVFQLGLRNLRKRYGVRRPIGRPPTISAKYDVVVPKLRRRDEADDHRRGRGEQPNDAQRDERRAL